MTDNEQSSETDALQRRVRALEDLRNLGLLYGLALGGILFVVVFFFAFQNRQLSKQLSAVSASLENASGTLQRAQELSSSAAHQSGGSAQKFEALESMLSQAIDAANDAMKSAGNALEVSDRALQETAALKEQMGKADQAAAAAMQEALAAKTVADKNYARLRSTHSGGMASDAATVEGGEVDVFVDGSNIKIWFREGAAHSREVRIEESHYSDVVMIPPGATATLRGSCNDCEFRVERKLKGRIEDEVSGSNNLFLEK